MKKNEAVALEPIQLLSKETLNRITRASQAEELTHYIDEIIQDAVTFGEVSRFEKPGCISKMFVSRGGKIAVNDDVENYAARLVSVRESVCWMRKNITEANDIEPDPTFMAEWLKLVAAELELE